MCVCVFLCVCWGGGGGGGGWGMFLVFSIGMATGAKNPCAFLHFPLNLLFYTLFWVKFLELTLNFGVKQQNTKLMGITRYKRGAVLYFCQLVKYKVRSLR